MPLQWMNQSALDARYLLRTGGQQAFVYTPQADGLVFQMTNAALLIRMLFDSSADIFKFIPDITNFGRGANGNPGSYIQVGHFDNTDGVVQANSSGGNTSLQLRATGTGTVVLGNATTAALTADPSTAVTSKTTALLILAFSGGAANMTRVTLGANDSGGTGFSVLRVPN